MPSQFIPLLEKHDLLIALAMYILKLVCKLFVQWKGEVPPSAYLGQPVKGTSLCHELRGEPSSIG
jgi:EAL domain-containing protein (putative c-di-GMP-specific phosphodiesterase class I)